MREIKVRVWNKKEKKMYYLDGNILDFLSGGRWLFGVSDLNVPGGYRVVATERNGVLMWYTGLKGRNGKEIYEGDILNWDAQESQPAHVIVVKEPGGLVLKNSLKDAEGLGSSMWVNRNIIENDHSVIGNIYKDKKLLKERKKK